MTKEQCSWLPFNKWQLVISILHIQDVTDIAYVRQEISKLNPNKKEQLTTRTCVLTTRTCAEIKTRLCSKW